MRPKRCSCCVICISRENCVFWRTENRLANKPSKRDLARSYALFDRIEKKYRLNSLPGEIPYKNYIRIDNSDMEPMEAAELIKRKFAL